MRKNVYFAQVCEIYGNSAYLPYGAGAIIANCLKYPEIACAYHFPDILFFREDIDVALSRYEDPYIAAFSNNIWNTEYNKVLAKRVKEKYPECIIIFGGHNIGKDDKFLRTEPYIDILSFGEGEETFADLLKKLPTGDISDVKSIAYRKDDEIITTPRGYYGDLSSFPSPYTAGVFDTIIEKYKDLQLDVIMETNRGCPYSCAYCEWDGFGKMRLFPMEKIKAEIEWMAKNKIQYVLCGDSNFGLFKRDLEITDALVKAKRKYGYPKIFRVCYEKNSAERVFQICKTLNAEGMDKGATISFQTMCPEALENIGRKNLTLEHFSYLMKKYSEAGIPTYSELILGLPGETFESFAKGICTLIKNGQHSEIFVFSCDLLPCSPMAEEEYLKKYKIETVKVNFLTLHGTADSKTDIGETYDVIRSTYSMDRDSWVKAYMFSIYIQAFHAFPILRNFAIYLYEDTKTEYYDFYTEFIEYLLKSPGYLGDVCRKVKKKLDDSLKDGKHYASSKTGNVNWSLEEGVFLETMYDYEASADEIMPYLRRFDIPEDIFEDLTKYQTAMLRKPYEKEHSVELKYDFPSYFNNVYSRNYQPLQKRKTLIKFTPERTFDDFETYAREIVWYGRRKEAALYKKKEIEIVYK
ncbi:MAG: radical SAM protein [Clostridia bacterium]|nr:radical SAM protein [Clostridia bacterium]